MWIRLGFLLQCGDGDCIVFLEYGFVVPILDCVLLWGQSL